MPSLPNDSYWFPSHSASMIPRLQQRGQQPLVAIVGRNRSEKECTYPRHHVKVMSLSTTMCRTSGFESPSYSKEGVRLPHRDPCYRCSQYAERKTDPKERQYLSFVLDSSGGWRGLSFWGDYLRGCAPDLGVCVEDLGLVGGEKFEDRGFFLFVLVLDTGVRALNGPGAPLPGRLDSVRRPWPVKSVDGCEGGQEVFVFGLCARGKQERRRGGESLTTGLGSKRSLCLYRS